MRWHDGKWVFYNYVDIRTIWGKGVLGTKCFSFLSTTFVYRSSHKCPTILSQCSHNCICPITFSESLSYGIKQRPQTDRHNHCGCVELKPQKHLKLTFLLSEWLFPRRRFRCKECDRLTVIAKLSCDISCVTCAFRHRRRETVDNCNVISTYAFLDKRT
jgi:hypothetical protein